LSFSPWWTFSAVAEKSLQYSKENSEHVTKIQPVLREAGPSLTAFFCCVIGGKRISKASYGDPKRITLNR
jgi:hypothetical protein